MSGGAACMSQRQSISGLSGRGQPPVSRRSSRSVPQSATIRARCAANPSRLAAVSGMPVGRVALVYMPKWIVLPPSAARCQSGDAPRARMRRRRESWSLTSAFMG